MPNLINLLKKEFDRKKWQEPILQSSKQFRFLLILTPLMEYVFRKLKTKLAQHFPKAALWIQDPFLTSLILQIFYNNFNSMIIRVCILEMHIARRELLLVGKTSDERFDFFVKTLSQTENSIQLFNKYTVLKDQLEHAVLQNIQILEELFSRLDQDYFMISTQFLDNDISYRLSALHVSGDRHHGGRAAMILEFTNLERKRRIVYKPHSMGIDIAFQKFIDWINQHQNKLKLLTTKIFDREQYGWCEFIDYHPCKTKKEIKRFYYRMGAWLMLTYLLRGYDLHAENLIAHGEYPVVVDYECLFSPYYLIDKKQSRNPPRFLVTDIAILPHKTILDKEHKGFDFSGMGGTDDSEAPYYFIRWKDVGKDTMHAERYHPKPKYFLNKPKLSNQEIDFLNYQNDFLKGFKDTYLFFLKKKTFLLSDRSPLKYFNDLRVRVVLRPSMVYENISYESWHPQLLYNENAYKKYMANLKKTYKNFPLFKKVIVSELYDISQNDIPIFTTKTTSKKILNSRGKSLPLPVIKSGMDYVYEHIHHFLSENDLRLQTILILNSFEADKINKKIFPIIKSNKIKINTKPLNFLQIQNKAIKVAKKELNKLSKTFFINNNIVFWPNIHYDEQTNLWISGSSDLNLYNGISGIMICYAYAAELFDNQKYHNISQLCFDSIRAIILKEKKGIQNVGAFEGIAGIIYSFAALYRLWKIDSIKKDIKRLFKYIKPELNNDKFVDIMSGSAGALAVLISLQDLFSKKELLPYARLCVKHILKVYPDPKCYSFEQKKMIDAVKPLLGFSHGVAGMAWALSQYDKIEPRKKVKRWIQLALKYERQYFNAAYGNWPDFRKDRERPEIANTFRFMTAWCHGAPGIGLARLDMSQFWVDKHFKKEFQVALETTKKEGLTQYQCLCHGSFGNLELFLTACQILKDPKIVADYQAIASALIHYLEKKPVVLGMISNEASPGIMTGRAGIIYQMLRIAAPEKIPNLLLLKPNKL